MARLTRAQQQEHTRGTVLAAAREEFAEHGYAEAKVDRIADRAELTRGAVYSNFPSKRALYLAVLLAEVNASATAPGPAEPPTLVRALESFARVRLARLPLSGDSPADAGLRLRSLTGVFVPAPPGRPGTAAVTSPATAVTSPGVAAVLGELHRLEAVLLGLALEFCPPRRPGVRRVRLAELVLTLLDGAAGRAEAAPGTVDPFDVAQACAHLAGLDLGDRWDPPHLAFVRPASTVGRPWECPVDLPVEPDVFVVLGAARLGAAEEAIRAARPGERVAVAIVTSAPAELGALVRLRLAELTAGVRQAIGRLPDVDVVVDDTGAAAAAAG
ncbi:helix-turn-helix domain-containing protein, partial [Cryptosporangium japonicum]